MLLNPENPQYINQISAYDGNAFSVNGVRYASGLILSPDALIENWLPGGFASLRAEDLESLLALKPALVLIGTGQRQRFPAPALLRPLIEAGISPEIMDTGSACRTFNLLAGEGRRVVVAMIPAAAL
jgi:uncharacterized protein